MITIFTDGSSRGNPGPGGWGVVIIQKSKIKNQNQGQVLEIGGRSEHTTNNRMELTAVIQGLRQVVNGQESVDSGTQVTIHSDSSYVINGATKWMAGWKRTGWMTKSKDEVLNTDLWMELDRAISDVGSTNITWQYVGGHIGVHGNERCDEIATAYADEVELALYDGPLSGYSIPDILNVSHDASAVTAKKSSSAHSRAKAYSYVSAVKGEVRTHASWAECEKRVKGVSGARFKKSIDAQDEAKIVREFSS